MTDPEQNTSRADRDKALFNEIAASYSAKDLGSASIPARKMRLVQSLATCRDASGSAPDILEVGCGTGYSAQYLEGQYGSYTGVDYSEMLIEHARAVHQQDNVAFAACDFFAYEPGRQFDIIVMIGVLHHMQDVGKALIKCRDLLKPGGYLVANEPHPGNPLIQGLRKIRTAVDSTYSEEQVFLSPEFLQQEYARAGFSDIRTVPQGYFSTPFAEVILKPQFLFSLLCKMACVMDRCIEPANNRLLQKLSWNVIACGRAAA